MENVTHHIPDSQEENQFTIATIYIIVVLMVGLVMNAAALFSILCIRSGRRRTTPLVIMTSLLICDFTALVVYMARRVARDFLISFGNNFFCNVFGSTNIFFSLLSGLFAMLLAIERYCAIAVPFQYRNHFNLNTTVVICFALTVAAVMISVLPILGIGSYVDEDMMQNLTSCRLFWKPREPPLYTIHFLIYYGAAFTLTTLVVCCNLGLTSQLVSLRRKVADLTQGQHVSRGREIKFVWTVMVITFAFLLCWVPWMVSLALCKFGVTNSPYIVTRAAWLLLLNHALDPCIFLLSRHGRRLRRLYNRNLPDTSAETTVGLSLVVALTRPK